MTPHEFVLRAYGKENDPELEAYITEQLSKASINPMDLFSEYQDTKNQDQDQNKTEEENKNDDDKVNEDEE